MSVEQDVLEFKRRHAQTWRDKSDWYWLAGLCEEVAELALSLAGLHRGPVEWELGQIVTIAMNWLEKRQAGGKAQEWLSEGGSQKAEGRKERETK